MEIILLGTGWTEGVPSITLRNQPKIEPGSKSYRRRPGIIVKTDTTLLLFDVSQDLREHFLSQNLNLNDVDAVLITHTHHDHIADLDAFLKVLDAKDIYATKEHLEEIEDRFNYVLDKKLISKEIIYGQEFTIGDITIKPLKLHHPSIGCTGYKLTHNNKTAVIATDTSTDLSQETLDEMRDVDLLIADAICENFKQMEDWFMMIDGRLPKTMKHSSINDIQELLKKIQPKKTVLTHFSSVIDSHEDLEKKYQTDNFIIGYDGIKFTL